MCGIAGFRLLDNPTKKFYKSVYFQFLFDDFQEVLAKTSERGRDSFGVSLIYDDFSRTEFKTSDSIDMLGIDLPSIFKFKQLKKIPIAAIANFRAEPTTERVDLKVPATIQPFSFNDYSIVHNGTIWNDKEILKDSAVEKYIREFWPGKIIDSWAIVQAAINYDHTRIFDIIQGSYALAIVYPTGEMLLARNYRDLAIRIFDYHGTRVLFFASKPEYLDFLGKNAFDNTVSIPPYSYVYIKNNSSIPQINKIRMLHDDEVGFNDEAVVILSGGLDSTTCATIACRECHTVILMHFKYGCKAEKKEVEAVKNIYKYLKEKFPSNKIILQIFDLDWLKNLGGSTLTDPNRHKDIATKDTGVETHNEWVPARNTVMMSLAAAYCDRYRIGNIYLGLNMEEGSAFPDNTTEFYQLFEKVLKVGTTSRPSVKNPLGNYMKHEIYKIARDIEAPIHLSWSCYHGGEKHCGICGPCTMRKIAAEMNNMEDNIEYEDHS